MKKSVLLLVLCIAVCQFAYAQCPLYPASPDCELSLGNLNCDFGIDGYCNTLSPQTSNPDIMPGCNGLGVINNPDWIAFVAGSTSLTIQVIPSNCQGVGTNGNIGFQAAIYGDCSNLEGSVMDVFCDCTTDPVTLQSNNFVFGETYYLLVDGCGGDICDYEVFILSGNPFPPAPLGAPGPIQTSGNICTSSATTYTVNPLPGATEYIWNFSENVDILSGAGTNSITVSLAGTSTSDDIEVCVRGLNDCSTSPSSCGNFPIGEEIIQTEIFATVCEGECYDFFGNSICETGTYVNDEVLGCLTNRTVLTLVVELSSFTFVSEEICAGDCVSYNGNAYCTTGLYDITLVGSNGCDSLIQLDLVVNNDPVPDLSVSVSGDGNLDCTTNSTVELTATSSQTGVVFFWEGPGIDPANANLPTQTVNVPGVYTITATTSAGCSSSSQITINGSTSSPVLQIDGNEALTCNNTSTTLVASANENIALYEWTGPNNLSATGVQLEVTEPGVYTVTGTTSFGCTGTASVEVQANNVAYEVDGGPDRHYQCVFVMQLEAPGVANAPATIEYEWTTTNGNILSGENTLTPTINSAGTYLLTATDPVGGCTGSTEVTVYNSLAILEENVLFYSCLDDILVLDGSASYNGSDATIQWTTNNGNIVSGGNTLTPTVDAPGTYQLVIVKPGCVSFATLNVIDNTTPPDIEIVPDNDTVSCYTPVTLSAVSSQTDLTYQWFRDGQLFLNNGPTFPASRPAFYELIVTNSDGCTNSASITITGNVDPTFAFIEEIIPLSCNGEEGTLLASTFPDNPFLNYFWFTNDGIIDGGNGGQVIDIIGSGTYCVDIFNPLTGCAAFDCITIEPATTIEIIPTITDASCPGAHDGAVELNVSGGCGAYTYMWNTVPPQFSSTLTNLSPGTYEVVVTDCDGCTSELSVEVGLSSNSAVVADAGPDAYFDCLTNNLYVLDGGNSQLSPDAEINWTTPDGTILDGQGTLILTVGAPGTYTLNIVDPLGCFDTDEVIVYPSIANAGPDQQVNCNVNSITLDGSLSQTGAGFSYNWTTTSGNILSGGNTLNPEVDAEGTYTLTVTSPNGCTASDEVTVTGDFTLPNLQTDATVSMELCFTPVILTVNSSTAGATFSWLTPGGEVEGQSYAAQDPGFYTAVVTGPNGCSNQMEVEVVDNRILPFIGGPTFQYLNCFNGNPLLIEIDLSSVSDPSTNWFTNDGNIVSTSGLSVLVDAPGSYVVEVTDNDNFCINTTTFVVQEDGLSFMVETAEASCGEADGGAQVTTTGINDPVFNWSNGASGAAVDGLAVGDYTVTVSSAAGNCEEILEVTIAQDPSCFVTISGFVLDDDATLNCEANGIVTPVEGATVQIVPDGTTTTTNENGYYEFNVPPGDYTISVITESPFQVFCPASGAINVSVPPGGVGSEGNNFFLDQLSGFDLFATAGANTPVPGQNQNYQVTYCNNGFQTIFGAVVFQHDPFLIFDPDAAGASSYDEATNTATWDFVDLSFFECEFLSFSALVSENAPEGYTVVSEITITPLLGDLSPNNNTVIIQRTIPFSQNSDITIPNIQDAEINGQTESEMELLQNHPNPFRQQTEIGFYLSPRVQDSRLEIYDANGRLLQSFQNFSAGYNTVIVEKEMLNGAGVYVYRLVSENTYRTGKMILF